MGSFWRLTTPARTRKHRLTEGELFGDVVECPLHGAAFNLRNGAVESFPAVIPLPVFTVRIVDDEVQVEERAGEP